MGDEGASETQQLCAAGQISGVPASKAMKPRRAHILRDQFGKLSMDELQECSRSSCSIRFPFGACPWHAERAPAAGKSFVARLARNPCFT